MILIDINDINFKSRIESFYHTTIFSSNKSGCSINNQHLIDGNIIWEMHGKHIIQ